MPNFAALHNLKKDGSLYLATRYCVPEKIPAEPSLAVLAVWKMKEAHDALAVCLRRCYTYDDKAGQNVANKAMYFGWTMMCHSLT